jgi:glutamate synthase domain-containing protein 2
MRGWFILIALSLHALVGVGAYLWTPMAFLFGPLVALTVLGIVDMLQTRQTIRRNFPVIGHGRYLLESIRPELNQYFVESNTDGLPFSRDMRSVAYQRAKGVMDTVPFGTQRNLYEVGAEWLTHSIVPTDVTHEQFRVDVGEEQCAQPYSLSLLNVSAMSFGALSDRAILALSRGAKAGGFAHNTGEGGVSLYHLEGGADLIWQIGTGYFGCRAADGGFDADKFSKQSANPAIKMIEIKISQGAKPAHGGILPAAKLTREIAEIRGVPIGQDVNSPPRHKAFSTPLELLAFISRLRELSGGKPVGFKLCIGKRREFLAICKAIVQTGQYPDYIAVDGSEGGTGAAPLEFSDSLGLPLIEALAFVHSALTGIGYRDRIKVIAAGKVITGFHIARLLCLGADACYSARAMMLALGCIQARRCNNNRCPTGIATQDQALVRGIDVEDKTRRVHRYHANTVGSFAELLSACGLSNPSELRPWNLQRRVGPNEIRHYGELYEFMEPGALLDGTCDEATAHLWKHSSPATFKPIGPGVRGSVLPSLPSNLDAE